MTACAFCGRMYRDERPSVGCAGCVLASGCGHSRCPFCGYENQRPLPRGRGFWRRLFRRNEVKEGTRARD